MSKRIIEAWAVWADKRDRPTPNGMATHRRCIPVGVWFDQSTHDEEQIRNAIEAWVREHHGDSVLFIDSIIESDLDLHSSEEAYDQDARNTGFILNHFKLQLSDYDPV